MLRRPRQAFGILAVALTATAPCWLSSRAGADDVKPTATTEEPPLQTPPAGGLSQFTVNDDDPEKSVPTAQQRDSDPIQFGYFLMDLTEKAGRAAKKGDHRAAVKYYAALARAVPDRSIAFSKLCASYEALGEWDHAVEACRAALGRPGVTVADSVHFVKLVLDKKAPLDSVEVDDVSAVVDHLKEEPSTRAAAIELQCDIGLRLEDGRRLEECTTALARTAPGDPKTISYQWALALQRKDFRQARQLIERAKDAGMPKEGIERMEQVTLAAVPRWQRTLRDPRCALGLSITGIAAIVALVLWRRRSTARATAS